MNIAIDVIPIRNTGEMGGAFQTVMELIKGLAKRYKDDKYYLITAEWNHDFFESFEQLGIERILLVRGQGSLRYCPNFFSKVNRRVLKIIKKFFDFDSNKRILKSKSIDVLFCPMSAVNYSEAGIPVVSLIYDLQHEYYPQFFSLEELNHRKKFYREIAEQADYVVCISEYTKNSFVERLGFPEQRSVVVPISIQDRVSKLNEDQIKEIITRFGLLGKKYIYFPANFWPHKNHYMLFTAVAMLKNKHRDLDLHLCLTGSLLGKQEELKDILNQMGLKERVHHFGYVTDIEVAGLMSGSSALIFPSLFEGFGIPVAEAMAAGVPVLCSNNTSLPEVGGDAAIYFDPRKPEEIANKIYEIMVDDQLRTNLTKQGLVQIKRFNRDNMIEDYHRLLTKATNGRHSRRYVAEGIYADGWTGKRVDIYIGALPEKNKVLYAELHLPSFNPNKKVKLLIKNKTRIKKLTLQSGETAIIKENLSEETAHIYLEISDTFIPHAIGLPDNRELGLQIVKMEILESDNGQLIKSFV